MGEEYQPDLLHPAWAPGAVAPLPRFEPHWSVVYNMQYSNGESNQDFITGAQPQVGVLARLGRPRGAGWRAGGAHACIRRLDQPCIDRHALGRAGVMTAWPLSEGSRADLPATLQMGPVTFRAHSWLDDSPDLQHPQVGGVGPGRRLALRCMCVARRCRLHRRACQTALPHLPLPAHSLTTAPSLWCCTPCGSSTMATPPLPALRGFTTTSTSPPMPRWPTTQGKGRPRSARDGPAALLLHAGLFHSCDYAPGLPSCMQLSPPPHPLPLQAGGEDAARLGPAALRAAPAPAPAAQANHHIRRVRRSSCGVCGEAPRHGAICALHSPAVLARPQRTHSHPCLPCTSRLSQRPAAGSKNGSPRCYCRLLFCNGYRATESPNAWSAAQAVAAAYAPPNTSTTHAQPPPQLQLPGQGGAAQQQAAAARSIVFHRRSAHSRQLANLQELVDRCSQWDWAGAAAGQGGSTQQGAGGATQSRPSCSSHVFGDVPASVAAAQAADVFIGTHGANLANSERQPLVNPCCSAPWLRSALNCCAPCRLLHAARQRHGGSDSSRLGQDRPHGGGRLCRFRCADGCYWGCRAAAWPTAATCPATPQHPPLLSLPCRSLTGCSSRTPSTSSSTLAWSSMWVLRRRAYVLDLGFGGWAMRLCDAQ